MKTKYAVIFDDLAGIYGVGTTKEEAKKNSLEWLDDSTNISDINDFYSEHGLCVVEIAEEAVRRIKEEGFTDGEYELVGGVVVLSI